MIQIFSLEKLIGTTELQIGDESMGHLFGEFTPTEEYYKHIQPIVWQFNYAPNSHTNRWESLQLIAKGNDGTTINAAGGITIDDVYELQNEPMRLDIAGVDLQAIDTLI